MKIIALVNALPENSQQAINEREFEKAYNQLLVNIKSLMNSSDFGYVYQEFSFLRVELLCAKDFLLLENKNIIFYLNQSINRCFRCIHSVNSMGNIRINTK